MYFSCFSVHTPSDDGAGAWIGDLNTRPPQAEAFQMAMGTILPSIFLSGYIFLIENMPVFFQGISRVIPTTYYIQILRGVILCGAGLSELWTQAAVLTLMGCLMILLAARLLVKQGAR